VSEVTRYASGCDLTKTGTSPDIYNSIFAGLNPFYGDKTANNYYVKYSYINYANESRRGTDLNNVYLSFGPGLADDGYHLTADSVSCINFGDQTQNYPPDELDIDGQTRVSDNKIDIGAHEYIVNDAPQIIRVEQMGLEQYSDAVAVYLELDVWDDYYPNGKGEVHVQWQLSPSSETQASVTFYYTQDVVDYSQISSDESIFDLAGVTFYEGTEYFYNQYVPTTVVAVFGKKGNYTIKAVVDDGMATSSEEEQITICCINEPPMVTIEEGSEITVSMYQKVTLHGTFEDDGLEVPEGECFLYWQMLPHENVVPDINNYVGKSDDLSNEDFDCELEMEFCAPGDYTFEFWVCDYGQWGWDFIEVHVEASEEINQPPAGTVKWYSPVYLNVDPTLDYSVNIEDTTLPYVSLEYHWYIKNDDEHVQVDDPLLGHPTITFTETGIYTLYLEVNDGQYPVLFEMNDIEVINAVLPPTVEFVVGQDGTKISGTMAEDFQIVAHITDDCISDGSNIEFYFEFSVSTSGVGRMVFDSQVSGTIPYTCGGAPLELSKLATFDGPGEYTIHLAVTKCVDGIVYPPVEDTIVVTVESLGDLNVNLGLDTEITLSSDFTSNPFYEWQGAYNDNIQGAVSYVSGWYVVDFPHFCYLTNSGSYFYWDVYGPNGVITIDQDSYSISGNGKEIDDNIDDYDFEVTGASPDTARMTFNFPGKYTIIYYVKALDDQDQLLAQDYDLMSVNVETARPVEPESVPYATSFGEFEGYVLDESSLTLDLYSNPLGWKLESGFAQIRAPFKYGETYEDSLRVLWLTPGSVVSKEFNGDGINDTNIRMEIKPKPNTEISLCNTTDEMIAGVKFYRTPDDGISIQIYNGNDNTAYEAKPEMNYNYGDWLNLKFEMDYIAGRYNVYCTQSGSDNLLLIGSVEMPSNVVHNSLGKLRINSGFGRTQIYRMSIDGLNNFDYYSKYWGQGIEKEPDVDCAITYPCACQDKQEVLQGNVEIIGKILEPDLHAYRLRYIAIDQFDKAAIYNNMPIGAINDYLEQYWPIAWAGTHNVNDGGILGYWDTSVIPNGYYHFGIEIWREGLTYIPGGYFPQAQMQMFVQTKELQQVNDDNVLEKIETEAVYSVTSDLKCNTFTHAEDPDISVPWPGQIPFSLTRVYNNNRKDEPSLLQPGWHFNMEINLVEDTKNFFEPKANSLYPDYDAYNMAFGYIWVKFPDGSKRLFRHLTGYEGEYRDYHDQENGLAYSYFYSYPDINSGDTIERATSQDISSLKYILRTRDGSEFVFDCEDRPTGTYEVDTGNTNLYIYGNKRILAYPTAITDRFLNTLNFVWQDSSDEDTFKDALKHIYFTSGQGASVVYTVMDFMLDGTLSLYSQIQLRVSLDIADIASGTIYKVIGITSISDVSSIPNVSEGESSYSITNAYRIHQTGDTYDPVTNDMVTVNYVTHYYYDNGKNLRQISRGQSDGTTDTVLPLIKVDYDSYGRTTSRYDFMDEDGSIGYLYTRTDYDYLFIPDDETQSDSPTHLETVATTIFDNTEDGPFGKVTKREALAVQDAYGNVTRQETYLYETTVEADTDIQSLYDDATIQWIRVANTGNCLTKAVAMEYNDENNPCRPSATTEYFDGKERRTELKYAEYFPYNLLEKRVYINKNDFTLEYYDYHPLYNIPTGQITWQNFCQQDQDGNIQHNGLQVQSVSVYGYADGTIAPSEGKYLAQKKVLLDPANITSDDAWAITRYTYYANGQVETVTDPEGTQVQTLYDTQGYPIQQTALDVGVDQGDIITHRIFNDAIGRPVLQATQRGAVTLTDYDGFGRVYRVRTYADRDATTRSDFEPVTYQAMTPATDSHMAYDAFGRGVYETKQVTGHAVNAAYTETDYTLSGQPKSVNQYAYNSSIPGYQLASQTNYLYDSMTGQKIAENVHDAIQANGYDDKWTTYRYDALGQLVEITGYDLMKGGTWTDTDIDETIANAAVIKRTTTDYFASGQKKVDMLFNGPNAADLQKHTSYEYDILDKMTKSTTHMDAPANDIITRYGHNAMGKPIYTIDPEGNCLLTDYDSSGRKPFEYFAIPSAGVVWDTANNPATLDYTATHNLRVARQYTAYDKNNQAKSVTAYDYGDTNADNIGDTLLSYKEFGYDSMQRLISVFEAIEPAATSGQYIGATTTYAYKDSDADVFQSDYQDYDICITDGEDKKTWIKLDEFGNRLKMRYPSGNTDTEEYAYYGDGSLETKYVWYDDNNDQIYQKVEINYAYDGFGRLHTTTYPAPEAGTVTYTYTGLGQVQSVDDSRSVNGYTYTYDALGRVETVTDQDGYGYTTHYTYTADGQKQSIQVRESDNDLIYYTEFVYDEALRLQNVAKGSGSSDLIAGFTYTDNGNRNTLTYYRDGTLAGYTTTVTYGYNADNRLHSYSTIGGPFTFGGVTYGQPAVIDGLGRLKSGYETMLISGLDIKAISSTYSYDLRGQLITAGKTNINGSLWSRAYTYDLAGNIDQKTDTQTSVTTAYSYTGDLMNGWQVGSNSPVALGWDEYNGRLTQSETAALQYNLDGKLIAASAGTDSIALSYDPAGNRIAKSSTTTGATQYILDTVGDLPVILLEINAANGSLKKSYYHAHAQPLAQVDYAFPVLLSFYMHDRLGSVKKIIDSSGSAVHYYIYDPFGQILESNSALGAPTNAFLFTGQWHDAEIDQYHLRARQYDPALMRFITRDPYDGNFDEPLTLHAYLYCLNEPIDHVDPSGEFLVDITLSQGLSAGLRGYGMYGTAQRIKGYAEMLVAGVGMQQLMLTIAADTVMDYAGGKVFGLALKGAGKVAALAGQGVNKGLRKLFEGNHVLPKFLGFADDGMLNGLSRELHRGEGANSWHNILLKKLKEQFGDEMPYKLSKKKFAELMEKDPLGYQQKASQALYEAAQEFDGIHGGDIMSTAVLTELFNQCGK